MRLRLPVGSRRLVLIATVLVAAALAWYLVSPWYTLNRMAAAAEAGDRDGLAAYIDYEALRKDAKVELMRDILGPLGAADAGSGKFGALLADAMIGPTVEQMISPEGLVRAFGPEGVQQPSNAAPAPETVNLSLHGKLTIERKGLSTFVAGSENRPQVKAEFRRSYLGWKLSGIEVSKDIKSSG